jgi:hypothetical protein
MLSQEATVTYPSSHAGRKFVRTVGTGTPSPVWSKWTELPTLPYSPPSTIIVDGDNGDDVEGNGTEAKPVKTLQRAFALVPRIVSSSVGSQIRLKAGTYEIASREIEIPVRASSCLYVTSFSGSRDVEIVFADTGGGSNRGLFSIRSAPIELTYLRITKAGDVANIGIAFYHNFFNILNCEFDNFNMGINVDSALGNVQGCNYINCNNAVHIIRGGYALHDSNTATGTNYINSVDGGTIIKRGSQAAGVIATDRIIKGQII